MADERREAQKRNREMAMRKAGTGNATKWIVTGVFGAIIVGIIAWAVATSVVIETPAVDDFSAGLNEDGTITGVKALDCVDLFDYKNMVVAKSDVEVTDKAIQEHIDALCEAYPTQNKDVSRVIKDGDSINLDYVGKVDGVPFNGGSTNGAGTELTIGSGRYIPGFEDQVKGHKVGETFDINVTFPEGYSEELGGKDAVFTITVNYVSEPAVFNDEFVKTNFPNIGSTTKEYTDYYRDTTYEQKLYSAISKALKDNYNTKTYPKKYMKILKGQFKNTDLKNFETQKTNPGAALTFENYTGLSKKEYEASLSNKAMQNADAFLLYQAIYEDAGLTVTEQDVIDVLDYYGLDSSMISVYEENYGRPYLFQAGLAHAVVKYLETVVKVAE